ncbi:flagellar basal-body rod protein FlgF [Oricola sp.]|uniref:flagellar basal-body rod protein FlgF n=1 Tax=Oricola sp. TaxID=1979950 RepID=UPI003BACEFF4
MEDGIYVSISAQVAREMRINTIAQNIANAQTTGFKAAEVRFQEVLQEVDGEPVSFASKGVEYVDTSSGGLQQTGNPLDFAVRGNAWFGIQTPVGTVVTRDGRFTMVDNGDLVTLGGYPVLDPGGAPIVLNPAGGTPELGQDGFIRQNGRQVAAIGLFAFEPAPDFKRFENSGIIVGGEPDPVVDNADVGVVQGHLEESNVDALYEMTQLIQVQRAFETAAAIMQQSEDSVDQVIKELSTM